jgi:predicted  nucleic acid-binding Zn-ribbon protein
MATSLFLAGWEADGLRCPDHAISFERRPEEVHPISLVQMPNGTGKTTTLHLLRAALSGSAEGSIWTPNHVRALAKRGNESGAGTFRVKLLIDGRLTTICMNFDFDQGTVHYTTTLSSGMKNGFHPPQAVDKFLVPQFVNFFVFDGELAEHLLSREYTDAQTVIENLFQLSLFTEVATAVGQYYDSQTAGRSATEERGLARRRNRVDTLRQRIATMKDEKATAQSRYESTKRSLVKHKAKFDSALEKERDHGEKLRIAQKELASAHSEVQKLAQEVLGQMRDPQALSAALGKEMLHLKTSLDRVKLPESTAREFFEELADEALCVCGRELDGEHRKAIRERAKQYLGSEDVAFLNALKSDVASLVGSDPSIHEIDLDGRIERLLDSIRGEDDATTEYNALEADAVANDPALQAAKDEIDRLEDDLRRLDDSRKKYDSPDDSLGDESTFGIKVLERRLEDAERKLAEITDTINLRKKRGVLIGILESALQKARDGICQEISSDTNCRIAEVMPFNAIRVQRVERCLVLEGQEGGSAGETLSVAYAFLATLFNRVEHQLPFVVDSPANPIDLRVRAKVAELIPKLTRQFVAFTISTERQGFITPLEAAASEPIQYITLFRKGPIDLEGAANRQRDTTLTKDGVLVHGKEFFSAFHLETEENQNAVSPA